MSDDTNKKLDLPANCPICGGITDVTRIKCRQCGSEIRSRFDVSGFASLPQEYQKFEKALGVSYPTINKMLEAINRWLGEALEPPRLTRKEILDAIEKGELSVQEATRILKRHDDNIE